MDNSGEKVKVMEARLEIS